MAYTTQHGTAPTIDCVIRVKDGNLAPKGKGTLTISMMRDGKVSSHVTLPSETGVSKPFDLSSLERFELVSTRSGIYKNKQWIKPAVGAFTGFIVIPVFALGFGVVMPTSWDWELPIISLWIFPAIAGGLFGSGIYAGSKLNRIARVVATTNEGRYCVAEMPEVAFYFIQGIKAAENSHVETPVATSDFNSEVAEAAPAPA